MHPNFSFPLQDVFWQLPCSCWTCLQSDISYNYGDTLLSQNIILRKMRLCYTFLQKNFCSHIRTGIQQESRAKKECCQACAREGPTMGLQGGGVGPAQLWAGVIVPLDIWFHLPRSLNIMSACSNCQCIAHARFEKTRQRNGSKSVEKSLHQTVHTKEM